MGSYYDDLSIVPHPMKARKPPDTELFSRKTAIISVVPYAPCTGLPVLGPPAALALYGYDYLFSAHSPSTP